MTFSSLPKQSLWQTHFKYKQSWHLTFVYWPFFVSPFSQMTQWMLRLCWEKWHRLVTPPTTSTLLPFRWRDMPTWSLDVSCVRSPRCRNSLIWSQQNEARMLITLFCCSALLIWPWALMLCCDINAKVIWLCLKCLLCWHSQRNIYIEIRMSTCRNERQACSWFRRKNLFPHPPPVWSFNLS